MGNLPLKYRMIKCEAGEMREGVEVTGKRKGNPRNPKFLNLVVLPQEIKSSPL